MTLRDEERELVRQRAGYACEFCGVHESDAGGELTIDHFQPRVLEKLLEHQTQLTEGVWRLLGEQQELLRELLGDLFEG